MVQPGQSVSEEELHAYIDGGLDPARRLAVAVYLATHPREAARTEAFRAQKEGIRALFDHVLDQPVPDHLRKVTMARGARALWRRLAWAVVATSLVMVLVLGGRALQDRLSFLHDAVPFFHDAMLAAPDRPAGTLFEPETPASASAPASRRADL